MTNCRQRIQKCVLTLFDNMGNLTVLCAEDIVSRVLPFTSEVEDGYALAESILAPKPKTIDVWVYEEVEDQYHDCVFFTEQRFKDVG